jgi:hypothetical protein
MPTLPLADREQVLAFQKKAGELLRSAMGAGRAADEAEERIRYIKQTIVDTPQLDPAIREEARTLELRLTDLQEQLSGDPTKPRRNEPGMPGLLSRISRAAGESLETLTGPTATHEKNYSIVAEQFEDFLSELRQLVESDLVTLEQRLEDAGAPWTPGRGVPRWKRE